MLKLRAWNSITKKWRWINAPKQGVSDPVIVNFDDPDLATGVDIPYPTGAYPTQMLFDVTTAFDDNALVGSVNQDGEDIGMGSARLIDEGIHVLAIDQGYSTSGVIEKVKAQLTSGSPTLGSVNVRVAYLIVA